MPHTVPLIEWRNGGLLRLVDLLTRRCMIAQSTRDGSISLGQDEFANSVQDEISPEQPAKSSARVGSHLGESLAHSGRAQRYSEGSTRYHSPHREHD